MTEAALTKVVTPKAAVICQDIDLDETARNLLKPETTTTAFLALLMEQGLYADAVRFLARALPKRESVWWACVCARSSVNPAGTGETLKVLTAAEQWVYKPTEELRRSCFAEAQAAQFNHPAAWAAMGAFWSGGSMAPPESPQVAPADNLTAKAVAGSIMLTTVQSEPEKAPEKYRRFLQQGMDIARGGNGRVQPAPAAGEG